VARRHSTEVPSWFNPRDYDAARNFGISEWTEMLVRRQNGLSSQLKPVDWTQFLNDVLPSRLNPINSDQPSVPHSAIIDITDSLRSKRFRRRFEWNVVHGDRILLVDPRASDPKLQQNFLEWLAKERQRNRPPVKRRGRKAMNFELKPGFLLSLSQSKVLEVWDLDFYARVFDVGTLRADVLCGAIGISEKIDPFEWAKSTRKKTKSVLQNVEYLNAELFFGG
jgi:hypothetical protein